MDATSKPPPAAAASTIFTGMEFVTGGVLLCRIVVTLPAMETVQAMETVFSTNCYHGSWLNRGNCGN